MKVSELIKELQKIDPDLEVCNFYKDFYYAFITIVEEVDVEELGKICIVF